MQLTYLKGYPDFVGIRQAFVGFGNGPASYVAGGDLVSLPRFNSYIDAIAGNAFSISGNYQVVGIPAAVGARQAWKAKWLYNGGQIGVDGFTVATQGSGQTVGTSFVAASGGGGTGALLKVVVLTATSIAVTLASPGSGYTSAPTFTLATGGTPGTITGVTIGLANNGEVAAGTNLSAETIQLCGFCGEF